MPYVREIAVNALEVDENIVGNPFFDKKTIFRIKLSKELPSYF